MLLLSVGIPYLDCDGIVDFFLLISLDCVSLVLSFLHHALLDRLHHLLLQLLYLWILFLLLFLPFLSQLLFLQFLLGLPDFVQMLHLLINSFVCIFLLSFDFAILVELDFLNVTKWIMVDAGADLRIDDSVDIFSHMVDMFLECIRVLRLNRCYDVQGMCSAQQLLLFVYAQNYDAVQVFLRVYELVDHLYLSVFRRPRIHNHVLELFIEDGAELL